MFTKKEEMSMKKRRNPNTSGNEIRIKNRSLLNLCPSRMFTLRISSQVILYLQKQAQKRLRVPWKRTIQKSHLWMVNPNRPNLWRFLKKLKPLIPKKTLEAWQTLRHSVSIWSSKSTSKPNRKRIEKAWSSQTLNNWEIQTWKRL